MVLQSPDEKPNCNANTAMSCCMIYNVLYSVTLCWVCVILHYVVSNVYGAIQSCTIPYCYTMYCPIDCAISSYSILLFTISKPTFSCIGRGSTRKCSIILYHKPSASRLSKPKLKPTKVTLEVTAKESSWARLFKGSLGFRGLGLGFRV